MAAVHSHEWLIKDWTKLEDKLNDSPSFKLGLQSWKLRVHPRQDREPHTHLTLFLAPVNAPKPLAVKFTLLVRNWKDPGKTARFKTEYTFGAQGAQHTSYGWTAMLLLTQLTTESGFLRHDGALVLGVEVEELTAAAAAAAGGDGGTITEHAYPATLPDGTTSPGTSGAAASELGSDLLALLDHPGPTTDFTVIATADAPAAGGGGGTAAAEAKAADGAAAGDGDSMNSSRRFEVHRAILAARCPYFATLFDSGMDDSGARELTLPDTDPDALAALLRYIYGGSLTVTCREHARSCLQLADRLLLPKAAAMLRRHLLSTLSVSTVMPDLLWAVSAAPNDEELLTAAVDFAAAAEPDLPEQWLEQLAEAAPPALVARLFTACRRAARRVVT